MVLAPWIPLLFALHPARAAAPWAADLQVGDCAAVLTQLAAPTSDVERFVAGRCALRTGRAADAAALLGQVQGALAPHARAELARAQLDAGDGAAALATLRGVDLPGDADRVLVARARRMTGDAAGAVAALAPFGSPARWSGSDEALYVLGDAQADTDAAAAVAAFQALWVRWPTSTWADRAAARLDALHAPVPDFQTDAGRALARARAERLLAIQQAPLAIPLLDGIHAMAPFTGGAVAFMADALYDAKLYARAVEWYGRAGTPATSARAAFREALSTARAGDYPAAARLYGALITRFPTSAEADEAAWKPGYMAYDAGQLPEAVGLFADYINQHPAGKFLWDARWLRAWSLYRLGRTDEALAAFDKVIAGPNAELAAAARYWRARATASDDGLRDVIARHPDTSYAYFAAARLGRTWTAQPVAEPPAFPAAFLAAHPATSDARALADAGLGELAAVPAADVDAARAGVDTALPMAGLLLDLDRFQEAQRLARPWADTPAGRALATPRPYHAVIDRIADATGLPRLLPYAIMNAESGLDPSVTSPAGARGLMQLMPALAADLARDRVAGFQVDDLYRAGVNARLGATELSLLHQRFSPTPLAAGGALPMVIAGYNGGADAVARWVAGYAASPDADRFAEDISYTETRRYVRRVLGFYQRYRRVYGG